MPKKFGYQNQSGVTYLVLILLLVGLIVVIAVAVLYSRGSLKLPGKSSPANTEASSDVVVGLKSEYQNPFDKSTQYENPFSEYQNPFDQLK